MTKKVIYIVLILLGLSSALTIVISALIGQNAYVLANNLPDSIKQAVLIIVPICLVFASLFWWAIDLFLKPVKKVNYFAIAFFAVLPDAVFVIGSLLFASGH
jgi:Na+-driven multidrug efflux pump